MLTSVMIRPSVAPVIPWKVWVEAPVKRMREPVKLAAVETPVVLKSVPFWIAKLPVPARIKLPLRVVAPAVTLSPPPREVRPVPTVRVLVPLRVVAPLMVTAPVPVLKVPELRLWSKLATPPAKVMLLPDAMLVSPFKETVPVPVPKVVAPDWVKLPVVVVAPVLVHSTSQVEQHPPSVPVRIP